MKLILIITANKSSKYWCKCNNWLEFLGSLDHQVKVRGFRIETGEIEAILNTYAQIQNSVVFAKENKAGMNQLIAYIILHRKLPARHNM